MEGGIKGKGGQRSYFMLPREMYHRNSSGNFTEVHAVGISELVCASSAKRRLLDEEAVEIRFRKAEINEKEGR